MTLHCKLLSLAAACFGLLTWAAAGEAQAQAAAQDYPNRPVRWILGFAPGGPTDIVVRLLGQYLSEKLGQQFVIENRPGAGGNLATQTVVNAAPDGYTLLAISHGNAINATLYKQLPYNFILDIVPVAGMVQMPNVLEVHRSVPANNVAEFIAYLKSNEGKVSYASAGNGTSAHLAAELFKAMTGTSMQHIPYRGSGPALVDMLSGQVHVHFRHPFVVDPTHPRRQTTCARGDDRHAIRGAAGPADDRGDRAWFRVYGLVRRRRAQWNAATIVEKLNREINAALADPKIKARFAELGALPFVATPAQMTTHVASETEKWGKAVKFSGATVD